MHQPLTTENSEGCVGLVAYFTYHHVCEANTQKNVTMQPLAAVVMM